MHPTLFWIDLGDSRVGLHTYGILVGLGLATGIVLFWREARRDGLDGGRILDLAFWSIIAGLVGSRMAFVALNARELVDACLARGLSPGARIWGCTTALRFWEGGLVFYGGALTAALVVMSFCRREGLSFWRVGDLAAPALAAGHALGRLGCFLAGCCFGKTCTLRWAVTFPPESAAYQELIEVGVLAPGARGTPPLHPTQLYEAAGELFIFGLLLGLRHRWNANAAARPGHESGSGAGARKPGGLVLTYAASYAVLRFVVEMFRGDVSRRSVVEASWPAVARAVGLPPGEPLVLSVSQLASLLLLAAVVGLSVWRRRRRVKSRPDTARRTPGP